MKPFAVVTDVLVGIVSIVGRHGHLAVGVKPTVSVAVIVPEDLFGAEAPPNLCPAVFAVSFPPSPPLSAPRSRSFMMRQKAQMPRGSKMQMTMADVMPALWELYKAWAVEGRVGTCIFTKQTKMYCVESLNV